MAYFADEEVEAQRGQYFSHRDVVDAPAVYIGVIDDSPIVCQALNFKHALMGSSPVRGN